MPTYEISIPVSDRECGETLMSICHHLIEWGTTPVVITIVNGRIRLTVPQGIPADHLEHIKLAAVGQQGA